MTFEPQAKVDPNRLEEAVRKVDFTPTGVRVWLRGRLGGPIEPSSPGPGIQARLVVDGSRQQFVLIADQEAGRKALQALAAAPANSMIVFGQATRAGEGGLVTVHVEGIETDE